MYGALELPMIWPYAWFSIITTTVWSGVGTPPAAFAVPPAAVQTPAAAAPRPTADSRAARVRRAGLPARGNTGTSGGRGAERLGQHPAVSLNPPTGTKKRFRVNLA